MALIFQYGSNCSESEMNGNRRLCGDAKFVDIAETVDEYELAFDVFSKNRGCAASNIVRSSGSKVWGVLYNVPDTLIERSTAKTLGRTSLDAIEGEGRNYSRSLIDVRRPNGNIETAFTYQVIHPRSGLTTNLSYVRQIIGGLREHGAPSGYIAKVKAIAAANNPAIAKEIESL